MAPKVGYLLPTRESEFDNLGSLTLSDKRDYRKAEQIFREGVRRGDPDSMVSLAYMLQQGIARPPPNAIDLLKTAAGLGHQGALRAYNALISQQQQLQAQRLSQQEVVRRMFQMFLPNIQRF
jgi:TPR repeat protein